MLSLIRRIGRFDATPAILDSGRTYTFADLEEASRKMAEALRADDFGAAAGRVAIFIPGGLEYVAALLGVWRCGATAVPLCLSHPVPELEWILKDSGAMRVLCGKEPGPALPEAADRAGCRILEVEGLPEPRTGPGRHPAGKGTQAGKGESLRAGTALILYTSGSTGRPKGVALTARNLEAQIEMLVSAWRWKPQDRILHVLPLHHTHGIVNALLCALWSGASCEFLTPFDEAAVWTRLSSNEVSVFMGVPTMYRRLIDDWQTRSQESRVHLAQGCACVRLMVSGSAALPAEVFRAWREITGHVLLERYGMTEIGMALSNPLVGERRVGTVGMPLPGVQIRRVDEAGVTLLEDSTAGEIEVRGPAVFGGYWNRPTETRKSFRRDWFRTGDMAVVEDGYWRILGRLSVDIIKSGGYKVSALEVENALLEHSLVRECAVIGVEDREWGERVCAVTVLEPEQDLSLEELRSWAKLRLAPYKVPRELRIVDRLPRNAMGKVVKRRLSETATGPNSTVRQV